MVTFANGVRGVILADGALHVMSDSESVLLQVRTPHLTSSEDAEGFAGKRGVRLDLAETLKLMRTLVDAVAAMG